MLHEYNPEYLAELGMNFALYAGKMKIFFKTNKNRQYRTRLHMVIFGAVILSFICYIRELTKTEKILKSIHKVRRKPI